MVIIFTLLILVYIISQTKKYYIPKIIWCYWDNNTPDVVQNMVEKNRKVLYDWDIRFLTNDTLGNYIKDNEFPKEYNTLGPQHKADYIRLLLLKKYGGCWVDASTSIQDRDFIEYLYNKSIKNKYELTACYLDGEINKDTQRRLNTPNLFIENWFILVPKDSRIMRLWYEEFDKAVKIGFMEYKKKIFEDDVTIIPKIYVKGDEHTYFTCHACIQNVLQKKIKTYPNINIINSRKSFFKILHDCNFECECIKKKYEDKDYMSKLKAVKIPGHIRHCLGI